jgi:hypothetical protein
LPVIVFPPPASPSALSTRTANSLLIEISGHLVEDIVNTQITQPLVSGGTVSVLSTLAMYAGAQVVLTSSNSSDGTSPTVATVTAFDPVALTATLTFPLTYPPSTYPVSSTLLGATFPTQQPSDPLWTQPEMLEYLARAQNEFLSLVPCVFQFTQQNIDLGEELQALPATAIELERVSIQGVRLYEVSQSQLTMADPQWQYNGTSPTPTAWFEDRAGYYGWGVAPIPQTELSASLLTSMRGPDTLQLTDFMIVPDPFAHAVKYRALAYSWSGAKEQRSPTMARVALDHFTRTVAIATRYMDGVVNAPGKRGVG